MKKIIFLLIALFLCNIVFSQSTGLSTETIISQRSIHLNGLNKATFGGGKSRVGIQIDLPENTVEWYYSFSTSGSSDATSNMKLALQLSSLVLTSTNILGGTLSASGLTQKAISSINIPEGSHALDVYLLDYSNYISFTNGNTFNYIIGGTVENTTQALVKVKNSTSGTYYIGLSNPAMTYAVNVAIEVVAVVKETENINTTKSTNNEELYPNACVSTTTNTVSVRQSFTATNCSSNADYYVWEDGDGTVSNATTNAPRRIQYLNPGTYTLKLTAYSASRSKSSISTVIMYVK